MRKALMPLLLSALAAGGVAVAAAAGSDLLAPEGLRRNHSTQYASHPDHPWHRLRKESPGVYESYVDLVPGEWTRVRIVVAGTEARLYVHGAEQPCLIVKDLKLGASEGAVALWIGPGTEAHFSGLRVTP